MLHAIVLAGGSGTRFWPKSRRKLPKQLLSFGSEQSLLEETVARVAGTSSPSQLWILTNGQYQEQVRECFPRLDPQHIIAEPAARDTAAAVGLGAALTRSEDDEAKVLVLPADQKITPTEEFAATVAATEELLDQYPDHIVVWGLRPTYAATGFGYIERGEPVIERKTNRVFAVHAFREKPKLPVAKEFAASGKHYWNAGIFGFRADAMLAKIAVLLPDLAAGLEELESKWGTALFAETLATVYPQLPKISIDFGVIQECDQLLVVEPHFEWDDVGSWAAVPRHHEQDAAGNTVLGKSIVLDAKNNIVDAGDGLVALMGVENLIVIRTPDVTLVCPRDRAEAVKDLLAQLEGEDERFL